LPTATVAEGGAFKAYGVDTVPQLVIVDPQGNVVRQWAGLKKKEDLHDAIAELIAQ
jgi:hypothetical protein